MASTHCKNGHEYTVENTYIAPQYKRGKLYTFRQCKECRKNVHNSLRVKHISNGICGRCKCRPLLEGYSSCEVCKAATDKWKKENRVRKDHYNKVRYETLKAQGLCVTCKAPTDGNVYCRTCTTNACRTRAYYRGLKSRNRWSKR